MQNIPYVRTAADLERKYNLSALPTIEKNTKTNQEQILKTNTMLEEFTAETIKNLENLQDQVDGNVTTYYYSGVPTLLNLPVSDWKEEEYNVHLGDLYYDKDTGYAYRFYLDTEPNVYGWVRITDSDITEALAIANTAQDTADAKRRVFVVEPKPPYDVGDIWFKEDKDLFRCKLGRQKGDSFNNSDWILATNYTDDTAANEAKAELSDYKVYVETTYETQADFIKEKEALELKVSKVETVANDKNKVFTSEPKTPYLPGDVYIKETTVEGMKQNLIYVCQTGRESGDYNPNDFSLQPSYASQSDLKLTDDKIAGVVQSVETLEKEVTTTKETTGNNSLYIEDALESRVLEYGIDGKSEQETRSGKNLYNSATITSVSNGTNNNGVITSNTFSTNNFNLAPHNIVDLEAGTYYFSADIRIISGTPTISKINDYITDATVVSKPTLSTTKQRYVYKKTYTSATQLTRMLFQFNASANAVVEVSNIMISKENTSYEPYGASPSPDYPSEIKSVEGIRNLFDLGTSLDDYFLTLINGTKINTSLKISDYVTATFTKNGISISNYNNSGYPWLSKIITLEKNTDYIISGSVSNGVKILGFPSLENGTIGTQISYIDNANVKPPKTFNSGNYAYYVISMYPPTNAYFEELQIEPGSIAHSYVPYGSWLKVKTTGKNLFNGNNYIYSVSTNGSVSKISTNEIETTLTGTWARAVMKIVGLKPNTNYVIGAYLDKTNYSTDVASGFYINNIFQTNAFTRNSGNVYFNFISDDNGECSIQLYGNYSDTSYSGTIIYKNIQLEERELTNYEPYKENISLIDMNKPNLFDKNNATLNSGVNTSTGALYNSTTQFTTDYIEIPNIKILNSNGKSNTSGLLYGAIYDDNKAFLSGVSVSNGIITISNTNAKYIRLALLNEYLDNLVIYEGFNDYYELCSIGDVKDQLIISEDGSTRIEKLLGKRIFNGSETIKEFISGTDRTRFSIEVNDIYNYTNRYAIPNVICNYLKPVSQDVTWEIGNISMKTSEKTIWFTLNGNMTQEQVKTWLSNNNVEVYYVLAEPYTIDLGQVDISLFENINHINLLDDIETDTRVKYLINNVMNGTYATKGELTIETNKIESSLNQKVSSEELDTTLEKLSNSITQEINNKENSILLKVSNDYSTKNETNQAKNEAISSANSSTDSKLTNYATNESVNASLALKVGKDENNQIVSMLNASANEINIKGDRFVLDSTNFKVDKYGNITARNGKFTGGELILEDDGTSTNASIKIQTKDTSTGTTITRETTYSGYGIESDIVTNYDYTQEDVQRALNIYTGAITPTQEDYARLDINKDGEIDIFDASSIQIVILMRISKDSPGHFSIDTHASFNDNIVITNGLKEKVVSIGLNGVEAIGGDIYYRDGDIYYLDGYVGGGYVTGSGTGFNLGTIFTQKSLGKIESVTLNEGATLTVRQGGKYLVGSATAGASMSLKHCYAQKLGDNAIGVYFNAPSAPTGVTNNDAIGVVMSNLSFTLNGYADEE